MSAHEARDEALGQALVALTLLSDATHGLHHGRRLRDIKGYLSDASEALTVAYAVLAPLDDPECDGVYHRGPWERIEGSDQASRCTSCGDVSGK